MLISGLFTPKQKSMLSKLEKESSSDISVTFFEKRAVVINGKFSTKMTRGSDLSAEASSFIKRWNGLFVVPLKKLSQGRQDKTSDASGKLVQFSIKGEHVTAFDEGIFVQFDRKNNIVSVRSILPDEQDIKIPDDNQLADAVKAFAKWQSTISEVGEVPSPTPVFLPAGWLHGESKAGVAFQFNTSGEDGEGMVLVQNGEVIPIGVHPPEIPLQTPVPSYHINQATGCPDFVHFGHPGCMLPEVSSRQPERVAMAIFHRYPELFGTGDPDRQLILKEIVEDSTGLGLGITVVLDQHFAGVPVHGCQLRVHMARNLAILSVTGTYFRDPGVDVVAQRSQVQCWEAAVAAWGAGGRLSQAPLSALDSAQLVILPTTLTLNGGKLNHLAWRYEFLEETIFVSAETGNFVFRLSKIHSNVDVLDSNQRRATFADNAGNEKFTDEYAWGATLQLVNGVLQVPRPDLDPEAETLSNLIDEINSFCRRAGRDGWNNAGGPLSGYVDATFGGGSSIAYAPTGFNSCVFSRGSVNESVCGHEVTHHLTWLTAGLVYVDESGAANESYSDVFGDLLVFSTGVNYAGASPGSYLNYVNMGAADNGGVHTNSMILNRAAHFLLNGAPGTTHKGIGRSKMSRLYFETLTKRLTPWSQFIDVLHCTYAAARDLAALAQPGLSFPSAANVPVSNFDGSEAAEVDWAFGQVGLSRRWTRGWFRVPGSSSSTQTHFPTPLTGGATVADVTVFARRADNNRMNNLVRATGPMIDMNAANSITLTMTTPPSLGTANATTVTTVSSPSFTEMLMEANLAINPAPPPPTGTPPPVWENETPLISRWPMVGGGNRFTDTIYASTLLPGGAIVEDVALQLFHRNTRNANAIEPLPGVPLHRLGDPGVSGADFGAYITANNVGSELLEVTVNCWHGVFVACRYRLIYWIRGTDPGLPLFPAPIKFVRS
jgi:Zn-dependent metalloprotease